MTRVAVCLVFALSALACGGARKDTEAPTLATVDTDALKDMVRGVDAAQGADGRDAAIRHLRAAVEKDAQLWEARFNLGVLLAWKGELAEAEEQLAAASELAPNAEDVALALAEVRRRRGDAAAAAAGLEEFVKAYPKALDARISLVGALRESGKIARAIEHAHEALVRRASDPKALAELALSHLARGEVDTAELLSTEALKADAKSAAAERTAGIIALERGDDAVAFEHFLRAAQLDPNDATARVNMGTVLLKAGVYEQAAEHFAAVLEQDADDEAAQLGLAAALRGQGTRERIGPFRESEKMLKSLLEKNPDSLAATFNLAVLYADFLQQPDDARPLFEQYLAKAPKAAPGRPAAKKWLTERKASNQAAPGGEAPAPPRPD